MSQDTRRGCEANKDYMWKVGKKSLVVELAALMKQRGQLVVRKNSVGVWFQVLLKEDTKFHLL